MISTVHYHVLGKSLILLLYLTHQKVFEVENEMEV